MTICNGVSAAPIVFCETHPGQRDYHPCDQALIQPAFAVPLTYSIDPADQLVTITGEYADADEWQALLARILADPEMRGGFAFLRDLRGATTPVDAATVVRLMDAVRRFWPLLKPSRAAVLTPREFDPAVLAAHALADTFSLPLRMFTSYDAAIQWLHEGAKK